MFGNSGAEEIGQNAKPTYAVEVWCVDFGDNNWSFEEVVSIPRICEGTLVIEETDGDMTYFREEHIIAVKYSKNK